MTPRFKVALRPTLSRAVKAKRDMEMLLRQLARARQAGDRNLVDRLERNLAFMTVNYL